MELTDAGINQEDLNNLDLNPNTMRRTLPHDLNPNTRTGGLFLMT